MDNQPSLADFEIINIDDLELDPNNANLGTEEGRELIDLSIERHKAGRGIALDRRRRVVAGNKTVEGLRKAGIKHVLLVPTDGTTVVATVREDWDLDDPETGARDYAYADNATAEADLRWAASVIKADKEAGVDLDAWFTEERLRSFFESGDDDDDDDGKVDSDGSLLELVNVVIDEPDHRVERGDVWRMGQHVLLCCHVFTDWTAWVGHLHGDCLFCPYPGPFAVLSEKALVHRLVLVQPDPYIAGHILDRWDEIHGEGSAIKDE